MADYVDHHRPGRENVWIARRCGVNLGRVFCVEADAAEHGPNDQVFLGKQSGNTFYGAADTVAQSWMFGQYEAPNVRDAVDPLIGQMIELLRVTNLFLEDALTILIGDVLLEGKGVPTLVGRVFGPVHDRVSVPFWTSMRSPKA